MSERDAMTLLAAANPVQMEDIAPMDFPVPGRHWSRKSLVLVAATAVLVAGAAGSIALGALRSAPSHRGSTHHVTRSLGPYVPPLTMERPLQGLAAEPITLAEAPKVLGAPVVLPDNSFVHPADAGPVWGVREDGQGGVGVAFPAQGIVVQYKRPPVPDPLANYESRVKEDPGMSLIDLNGTPGVAIAQLPDGSNWASIEFEAGGTSIVVLGHYDRRTLQQVAQSIVDRSR